MTRAEIQAGVMKALGDVAPETGMQTLRGDVPFRDQVDLDSFDFLNFMIGLHAQIGIEVPERDYPQLSTLDRTIEYLEKRLASSTAS
jgi:acyl carrier protein